MSSSRDEILGRLRLALGRPDLRFPPTDPEPLTPATRMAVTQADGDPWALAHRFGRELEELHGTFSVQETPAEARMALINQLLAWLAQMQANRRSEKPEMATDHYVLSWDPDLLPIPNLEPALADLGFRLVVPKDLHDVEQRDQVRAIPFGISGVEAAFASTGSFLVAGGLGRSRSASLLPLYHLVLIPVRQLYPSLEVWLTQQRQFGKLADYVRQNPNLSLITGPSKSADLEMILTLGVHGPQYVHAILFDEYGASG